MNVIFSLGGGHTHTTHTHIHTHTHTHTLWCHGQKQFEETRSEPGLTKQWLNWCHNTIVTLLPNNANIIIIAADMDHKNVPKEGKDSGTLEFYYMQDSCKPYAYT